MQRLLLLFVIITFINLNIIPQNKSFYNSKSDWQYIIDTTWGIGLSTTEKLQVFDSFWNQVDQTWGGFPNLVINWDSLKNYYRPIVQAGVSRGRFAGILSRMTRALLEWHAGAMDGGIDATLGLYPDGIFNDPYYPNHPLFHYRAGIPVININATFFRTPFGAGLTLLPDSSIMVYNVMNNHPLNLQPGDIILGYNGIPWKQQLDELLQAELPILSSNTCGTFLSSTTNASFHNAMMSAGMNWGLFDTIDVLKYSTNEIVHFPTSLLSTINPPYLIASEQLPVNGVPFPDLSANKFVSWGVVEGTTIGYIYVWDWGGVPPGQTQTLFGQAVNELMHLYNVTGLILDFRTNDGGDPSYANVGFEYLFNVDPTSNYSHAIRVSGSDHFRFTITSPWKEDFFTPTQEIFDHPIAVLTGPRCYSAGDYNAFRLRFHPMARFFGKPTSGAYIAFPENAATLFSNSYYWWQVMNGSVYSNYNNEKYMIHKAFPVDEEVWFTRDGVANGVDDVVKSAMQWINNLVYPHDIKSDKTYYYPDEDSIHITTTIKNPNLHTISARAYINNLNDVLIDSLDLSKQTINGTEENWSTKSNIPKSEDIYKISVKTFDQTSSTAFTLPNATRFTTTGPVILESISCVKTRNWFSVKTFLRNQSTISIANPTVKLICNDSWVLPNSISNVRNLPNIPPDSIVTPYFDFTVNYIDTLFPGYFNFKVEIMSDGWTYWKDSMKINITVVDKEIAMPLDFKLEQNFPNPFNSSSVIKYSIPKLSHISLKIFNTLGEEIIILVNEEKPAGSYELTFNAATLPSAVYFYRIQAGSFVETKKMILLK
jgi:hypothetical protein